MPIYEYRCNECGRELEALQKMSEAPLTRCPSCGKETLVKLISAAGFQLKGNGWYATDFRGKSTPCPAQAEGSCDAVAKTDAPAPCAGNCACHH
ncbi:MAG: zinc ribbon domain-containing protein [Burkholderiales bacterium]|jgi:putative FmdB family regulatory protein|nr:zinc ribbon domain-containing protein [Burkholderiales bacterium]